MKNLLLCCFLIFTVSAFAQERKLIWEENFDGNELDENHWNFELGDGCPNLCGWGNNEAQIYTKENHQVNDGYLTITAKLENGVYTSTRITTKNKKEFKYGRIEARAKLPLGQGLWPAFWMLGSNISEVGWPTCGEIDILEYVGRERESIFTSVHTADSHGMTKNTKKDIVPGIEEGFHTYAIDWNEDRIEFLIDNKLFYTFTPENKSVEVWPFNQPFFIIVNMAIGGNFGGPEIDDSIFPQEFVIDYIRVYEN